MPSERKAKKRTSKKRSPGRSGSREAIGTVLARVRVRLWMPPVPAGDRPLSSDEKQVLEDLVPAKAQLAKLVQRYDWIRLPALARQL